MDTVFRLFSKRPSDTLPAASHVRQRTKSQPQAVRRGPTGGAVDPFPVPSAAREFKLAPAPSREEWERRKAKRRAVARAETHLLRPADVLRREPEGIGHGRHSAVDRTERQERLEIYQPQYHSQSLPRQRTPSANHNQLSGYVMPTVHRASPQVPPWVVPPMDGLNSHRSQSGNVGDCRVLPGHTIHPPFVRQASQPVLRVADRAYLPHHVSRPLPQVPPPVPTLPSWYVPGVQAPRPVGPMDGYNQGQLGSDTSFSQRPFHKQY